MDFKLLVERFLKFAIVGTLISVIACTVIVKNDGKLGGTIYVSAIADVLYFAWVIWQSFTFRIGIDGKKAYYAHSLIGMGLYSSIAVIFSTVVHLFGGFSAHYSLAQVYTYAFFIFKSLHYYTYNSAFSFGIATSAIGFTALSLIIIAVLPLCVNKEKVLEAAPNVEVVRRKK